MGARYGCSNATTITGMAGVIAVGLLLFLADTAPATAAEHVSGAELRTLLPDSVATGKTKDDTRVVLVFGADGRISGAAETFLFTFEDTGSWQIVGDSLCLTWKNWQDAKRQCGEVRRRGNRYASYDENGKIGARFSLTRMDARRVAEMASRRDVVLVDESSDR